MKLCYLPVVFISLISINCKKRDRPASKIDYIPILSANSPAQVTQGQPIQSLVKCGFASYSAEITFLNFEIKEILPRQYEVRAKAFYDKIMYKYSLPVVMTFDTTLTLQTPVRGQYILRFYDFNQLVASDSVQVN